MIVEHTILQAYWITIIAETSIILVIQRPSKLWWWFFGIFLINSLTHPIAIYLLHIKDFSYLPIELGVFVIESLWYRIAFQTSWQYSFILSGVANIFSVVVGLLIRVFVL